MRLVLVECTPHKKTGGRKGGTAGPPSDGLLRIATNLLDVPAEIVADIYRQRWTIELFFRFFKHVLGCRHLLSTARGGIEIQTYCAIIACLLLGTVDRRQADAANLRNGMPLPAGLGRPGRVAGTPRKTQARRRLSPLVFPSAGSHYAARTSTADDLATSFSRPLLATNNATNSYTTLGAILEPNRRGDIPRLFGTAFALTYFNMRDELLSRMLMGCVVQHATSGSRFEKKTSRA